jgi:hypothetical protein
MAASNQNMWCKEQRYLGLIEVAHVASCKPQEQSNTLSQPLLQAHVLRWRRWQSSPHPGSSTSISLRPLPQLPTSSRSPILPSSIDHRFADGHRLFPPPRGWSSLWRPIIDSQPKLKTTSRLVCLSYLNPSPRLFLAATLSRSFPQDPSRRRHLLLDCSTYFHSPCVGCLRLRP